jgi:hypothetical protein
MASNSPSALKNYHSISSIINSDTGATNNGVVPPVSSECGKDMSPCVPSETSEQGKVSDIHIDIQNEIKRMKNEVSLLWQDLVAKTQRNFSTLESLLLSVERLERMAANNLNILEQAFQGRTREFATVEHLLSELIKSS